MTDKELFEKTEKVFNLKKKNKLIDNVYSKGNFKSVLENTSPIKSNYGDNTVSAARAAGRGAATVGGAIGKGLGALGRGVAGMFSGTKTARKNEAGVRKAEAQARQEEIKAQQARSNLIGGKRNKNKQTKKPTDPERLKRYENDARYRRVWDAYAKGKERDVAASDIDYYNKIEDEINKGTIDKAAEEKAYQEIRNKAAANIDDIIKQKSPETYKQLIAKKQNDNFIKFMLGDELSQEELKKIAFTISEIIKHNQTELTFIRDEIEKNRKLTPGDIKLFLKDLPLKATKETDPDEALKQTLKDISKQEGIPYKDLILKLNKEAEKFKIDDIVLGSAGAKHEVTDKDSKTGTVIVRSLKGKKLTKRFAKDLRLQQKSLDIDNSNEESFEQIVKRYR
jgi:hypothetical protein